MANLVFGTVVFHDNKEAIAKLSEILNRIGTANIYDFVKETIPEYDGDCRYYINDFEIKNNEIWLYVELAWDAHEELWNEVSDKLEVKWSGYFEWDDENPSIFNDPYGDYFRDYYYLDAEDSPIGESKYFETENEVMDYLEYETGIRQSPEDWNSSFYEDEWLEEKLGIAWKNSYVRLWITDVMES